MKKKIIVGTIIMLLILLICFNLNTVKAFTGEIDTNGYITLPSNIYITNGMGTGTISVNKSGYNLSYQKIDISESLFKNITTKDNEIETYYETINKEKKEKETNLTKLQTEYKNLVNSGTATDEELKLAKEKYDIAYEDYQKYITEANAKFESLKKEFYGLLPNYTNSWKKTTTTSNNIALDFSNYSGKIYFILWAKIENGTDTYYNFQIYSNEIKKEETEKPQVNSWENAKVSVEKISIGDYKLKISNAEHNDKSTYLYYIGDESSKPVFSQKLPSLVYDKDNNIYYITNISNYLELATDQYIYVYEQNLENGKFSNKLVLNKVKLQRPAQNKYTDVFFSTVISKDRASILFDTPWGQNTVRNIQFRIGKISDDTILQNIYNKKSNAFEDLLNYAKNSTAFYDKTVKSNSASNGYVLDQAMFSEKEVSDGEYYFLYAVLEDENGKYIKTEGVTLARCSKYENQGNKFYLFFYGSDDFSWKEFSSDEINNEKDDSIAPGKLPQTGVKYISIVIIFVMSVGGIITYKKYKKYNF